MARRLQSVAFVPRHLFIVSRETPYLADYMREQFRDEPDVEIFVDRRRGERLPETRSVSGQNGTCALSGQNGMCERRERQEVDEQLRVAFHAFVTVA